MAARASGELWHRVAGLRVRVARDARRSEQRFRGETWWVLQEPWTRTHVRIHDGAWRFLARLDGARSVAEAWEGARDAHGDALLARGEVVELLGWLHQASLLEGELPADAAAVFERTRARDRRRVVERVLNPLFLRLRLFDPDAWLERLLPATAWLYGRTGLALWCAWIALGAALVAARADAFAAEAGETLRAGPLAWISLYGAFLAVKAVHETSHGLALKAFAAQEGTRAAVREVGVVGLGLVPSPYVDASEAWLLRSKWRRAGVALAGMYAELAIAAGAAVVWSATGRGLLHAVAYQVMLVSGVATLVFNANPLVRFDGYYALSDLLEIPNLWTRSRAAAGHFVRARLLGQHDAADPARDAAERRWLVLYALASNLYRVAICAALALFLAEWLGGAGIVLGALAAIGWIALPAARSVAGLFTGAFGESRTRLRRAALAAGIALALLAFVPLPDRQRALGVVEPVRLAYVYLEDEGEITLVHASGAAVAAGEPLLVARNPALEAEAAKLDAQRRLLALERGGAEAAEPALAQALAAKERVVGEEQARLADRLARLTVRAPFAGRWIAPDAERRLGAYARPDPRAPLGLVASDGGFVVRVVTDQTLGPRVAAELGEGAAVSVRLNGRPDLAWDGVIERIVAGGQAQLPSAALGTAGGGDVATNPRDPQGLRPDERFFEVRVRPAGDAPAALLTGQRAVVRFALAPRPALTQIWTAARQLLQRRLRI